jgi:FdhD protein
MRTPGNDLELVAGFLLTEGIVTVREQIVGLRHQADASQNGANRVSVELAGDLAKVALGQQRNFYAASSCGICGKASIDSVRARSLKAPSSDLSIDPDLLCMLPDRLQDSQAIFGRTGGLHAAALFSASGELLAVREDVGRHNAVDKVIGWAMEQNLVPLNKLVMLVSGRAGFEIVQKALVAGVAVLASVSAPSDLAVNLAREFAMTLVGFLRGRRFVIYSGAQRLAALTHHPSS